MGWKGLEPGAVMAEEDTYEVASEAYGRGSPSKAQLRRCMCPSRQALLAGLRS